MGKLKYENEFSIGDKIKALDFAGDNEYWIAGEILGTSERNGAKVFEIGIEEDTLASRSGHSRVGDIGFVPMECFLGDRVCDNRITLISSLSFEEIQERISMLCDQAVEESNTSGCDINSIKEIEKEIDALEELRESKPEWGAFLKEVEESRKSEDCPF